MRKNNQKIDYIDMRPSPADEPSTQELVLWVIIGVLFSCVMFFVLGLEYDTNH